MLIVHSLASSVQSPAPRVQCLDSSVQRPEFRVQLLRPESRNSGMPSKDAVGLAIEKYKDHPSIIIINENVPFESRFSLKEVRESNMQKKFI